MSPRTLDLAGIAADADTMTEARIHFHTPEWHAVMDWLEFHGIDPRNIPAGTRVSRDECNRCIRYVGFVLDDQGNRQFADRRDPDVGYLRVAMVEQGEAPPLPYPDVITALLRPHPARQETS